MPGRYPFEHRGAVQRMLSRATANTIDLPDLLIEQSARLTLYLASLRVREYQTAHNRLPPNLQQAGVDTAGLTYHRTSESIFELSTRVQGSRLVYKSSMPDSVFLGHVRIRGIG